MKIFEMRHLTVRDGEKEILHDLSFDLDENVESITITGPSGGGKSTFLKVLSSLQDFASGELLYKGKSLRELDPVQYRREVSYCFQQPVLFGETVRDCLNFPFEIRKLPFDEAKVLERLSEVNLSEDFMTQGISKLSGGEKQRVALVRNILFAPSVLLLDEVTSGLDSENKAIVREFIQKQKAVIVEVTHDAAEIEQAQHLLYIEEGRMVKHE
ncbi:MAG: ATP-binding cassette domain-containing protein [Streptococcaceae bacterium]|jgi:putative ABC transport system ATP-binding protein|nr:ATP-binding cassette domain-containing protein [Streptococcaceae bacterium]